MPDRRHPARGRRHRLGQAPFDASEASKGRLDLRIHVGQGRPSVWSLTPLRLALRDSPRRRPRCPGSTPREMTRACLVAARETAARCLRRPVVAVGPAARLRCAPRSGGARANSLRAFGAPLRQRPRVSGRSALRAPPPALRCSPPLDGPAQAPGSRFSCEAGWRSDNGMRILVVQRDWKVAYRLTAALEAQIVFPDNGRSGRGHATGNCRPQPAVRQRQLFGCPPNRLRPSMRGTSSRSAKCRRVTNCPRLGTASRTRGCELWLLRRRRRRDPGGGARVVQHDPEVLQARAAERAHDGLVRHRGHPLREVGV